MRRLRRRCLVVVATGAALATAAVVGPSAAGATARLAAPSASSQAGPAGPANGSAAPVFPRPGGGLRAIHTYVDLFQSHEPYLLDTVRGGYRGLPFLNNLALSPDGRTVAVEGLDGRIGVAERHALLAAGEPAVRWTDLPVGSPGWWSPDGRALLVTTLDKATRTFTAHRYDVGTEQIRSTPIRLDCDTCTAGWAADSTRYVVRLRGPDPAIPDGPMQYLNPDGTPGPMVGANGHIWSADAYSPSRRYVSVEPSRPFVGEPAEWQLPKVFDLRTGTVVRAVATAWPLLGWYDDGHVVRVAPGTESAPVFEVLDIRSGEVTKRVPAPGLASCCVQLGSSAGLRGAAAELGF